MPRARGRGPSVPVFNPLLEQGLDALRALGCDPANPTDDQRRQSEKFDRRLAKYAAEWDAMGVAERKAWGEEYLAAEHTAGRYSVTLPSRSGGIRDLYSVVRYAERENRVQAEQRAREAAEEAKTAARRAKAAKTRPKPDAKDTPTRATRPATATEQPPAVDGPSAEVKRAKGRRRRGWGSVGFGLPDGSFLPNDTRLYDDD